MASNHQLKGLHLVGATNELTLLCQWVFSRDWRLQLQSLSDSLVMRTPVCKGINLYILMWEIGELYLFFGSRDNKSSWPYNHAHMTPHPHSWTMRNDSSDNRVCHLSLASLLFIKSTHSNAVTKKHHQYINVRRKCANLWTILNLD